MISLILTGGSRPTELDRFFDSLRNQAGGPEIEVIFVNQGHYDAPARCRGAERIRLRVVEMGERVPLSVARNAGLKSGVRGEIVAFPDDDCWYPPDLVDRLLLCFAEEPQVDGFCLNVFDPVLDRSYGGRPLGIECAITDHNLFRLPISVGIFLRRETLDRAGCHFDESLGAGSPIGSGEETELLARVLAGGGKLRYNGNLSVFHPSDYLDAGDPRKLMQYGAGFGYLNKKLIRQGRAGVIPFLAIALIRSVGGAIYHWRRAGLRRCYWARAKGIVVGLCL